MWDEERKLDLEEKPLAVQLNWTADNREGRFVLKTDKDSLEVKKPSGTTPPPPKNPPIYGVFASVVCLFKNKGKLSGEGQRRCDPNLQEDAVEERKEEQTERGRERFNG